MIEPTSALDSLLENVFRPMSDKLCTVIAELLGVRINHESVGLVAASVFGQCLHYIRHQELIGRMHPQLGEHPDVEHLANHIADFSLAGMRGIVRPKRRSNRRRLVAQR
jgi:hypothetical protein